MPLTDDYTFCLGDTGTVLNDDATMPFVDITRVTGLGSAPYRQTMRQHEGQDGAFVDAGFEQGRDIILEGTIYSTHADMEDFLDQLKLDFEPVRFTNVPFYFKVPGVAERVVFVKPLGVRYEWETLRRTGRTFAQFLMFGEDPRIYTATSTQTVVDVNFPTNVSGFSFDFSFDFTFGAPIDGNGETIVVGGNRPTPPLLNIATVTSEVINPRIVHIQQGRELRMNITLNVGDDLQLDPYRKTVLLNGVSNRRADLIVDEWFFLEPGSNTIGYRSDSPDDSTLTVTHRDAWR